MDQGSSVLNTPIKKIRNLTLHSPGSVSPVRYPSIDFDIKPDPQPSINDSINDSIGDSMLQMGYSQTLSNKVLRELDLRANELSNKISFPTAAKPNPNKRYSGAHRPLFQKMESISSHYAASRGSKPEMSSATKKRRTLNGPEEFYAAEDNSPTKRKVDGETRMDVEPAAPALAPSLSLAPPSLAPARLTSSPVHFNSSPLRASRISPSKGSMNLNQLLSDDCEFAKPEGPVRLRQTSLQMAGVSQNGDKKQAFPTLHNRPSIPSLQRHSLQKPSVPALQKKPSTSSLQRKPSIPTLQKKPSLPTLQKKPSIPTLQKKPSIPTLQKKPSVPTLQKKPSIPSFSAKPTPAFQKPGPAPAYQNGETRAFSRPGSSHSLTRKTQPFKTEEPRNVTVPKPFSLYNKPTVSSSQKSLGSLSSSNSQNSLSSSASQRSLNRFQKFKNRFA